MARKKHIFTPQVDNRRMVGIRLAPDIIAWLDRCAERECRSRNQLVEFMFRGAMAFDNVAHSKNVSPLFADLEASADRLVQGVVAGLEKSNEAKALVQQLVSQGIALKGSSSRGK